MSNPIAVIPLQVDSVDVQDSDPGIFLEIVRGLNETPMVRGTDTIVPSRPGRIAGDRVEDSLALELVGLVIGVGATEALARASFAALRQTVRELFRRNRAPFEIAATLEDGTVATINARPLNTIWNRVGPTYYQVSIELESVDPDWVIT